MTSPPQPPPPTASSLRARASRANITSPELELVGDKELAEVANRLATWEERSAEARELRISRFSQLAKVLPDDGEPNPAHPGTIPTGHAPCGRPEPCDTGDCAKCRAAGGRGHPEYLALTDELKKLHLLKSGGYGTGKDPFQNFTAVADASGQPRYLYAIHRSIEKLTRCLSLHAQGRADELGEEFTDTASLLLCAEAMRRSDAP